MKSFNSFYFLHIPKTGGRLYVFNFLEPLYNSITEAKIQNLNNRINSSDHSQWRKDITDFTYVTTIFRDPCKQLASMYIHSISVDMFNVTKIPSADDVNKKQFFNWVKKHKKWIKNYQSKNLVLSTIDEKQTFNTFLNNDLITKDNVFKKIDQISLILKPENLLEKNIETIQKKIICDLKINNCNFVNRQYQRENYRSISSEFIYNSLTQKDKNFILSINNVDSEVYETNKIFYTL